MRFALVPADVSWLSDQRFRETLTANIKAKVEESVREMALSREFSKVPRDVQVTDLGSAVLVEVKDDEGVALEKGVEPGQMRQLEGSVVPIKTPTGTIFRKVTSLSLMLGRWRRKSAPAEEPVKNAIHKAMDSSGEAVAQTKGDLETAAPPKVRDILGVR